MGTYTASAVTQFRDTNATLVSSAVSAAAVAANTVLQTVAVANPGNYAVTAFSAPGGTGTIANTDAGNVILKKNGAQVAVVPQVASATAPPLQLVLNLVLQTGDVLTLTVGPTNAAPAAVYYASTLLAQLVS
jgi:hypothetical protein